MRLPYWSQLIFLANRSTVHEWLSRRPSWPPGRLFCFGPEGFGRVYLVRFAEFLSFIFFILSLTLCWGTTPFFIFEFGAVPPSKIIESNKGVGRSQLDRGKHSNQKIEQAPIIQNVRASSQNCPKNIKIKDPDGHDGRLESRSWMASLTIQRRSAVISRENVN